MKASLPKVKTQVASDYVNLDSYVAGDHLIITKADGEKAYIGRVYQMSPLVGGGGEFGNVLQNVFKSVPDDSVVQVSLVCEPDHDAPATFAKAKDQGSPVVTELVARQRQLFTSAASIGWQDDLPLLNRRRVILSLAVPVKSVSDAAIEEARQRHSELFGNLRGCGFHDVRVLSIEEVVATYRQFSDLFTPTTPVTLDPLLELKVQIFGPDQVMDFRDPRVGSFGDNTFCTAVTCKAYPDAVAHGLMNLVSGAPFNAGPTKDGGGQRIMTPYILSTILRVGNQRREWGRVDKAIRSRSLHQNFPFTLGNEDPATKLQDLQLLKQQCAEDGNKFMYAQTTVFLFGRTRDEAIRAASSVKGTLDKLGFDGRDVRNNGLVRWAQTLPLNFSPKIAEGLACEAIMAASAACCLLPVYGDYLGNANKHSPMTGAAFITRRGSVHFHDPFVSNSNFNGVIAASPGAGKSFTLQYVINAHLAEGTHVFLLDNGKSAKKFCHAVGGEFNEFGDEGGFKPSLNPFTGLSDDEFDRQQETITALLLLMAYEGETIDPGARIALNEAVKAAYGQKQGEADIAAVIDSLRSIQASGAENAIKNQVVHAAANLIPRLKAFIESPSRGQYFRGKGNLDPRQQFTVFELGTLGDDEHLKKCVLFFVLNLLLTRIKSIPGRKIIFVDEAHDLLKDESAADVMEGIYLKGRKERVATWIIVQSLLKLSQTPVGPVILNQSPWKFILAQTAEEIGNLIEKKILTAFAGDPYFHKLIRSVETRKNVFAEILIIGPHAYEVVRLYVDRFTTALFSSEGAARDEVFKKMEMGIGAIDAVQEVLGERKESRHQHIKRFIDQLKRFDGLSSAEILAEIEEGLS